MQSTITTERFTLVTMTQNDAEFIAELVQTPGWQQYIGQTKFNETNTINAYIQYILDLPSATYWIICSKDLKTKYGIISLLKREHYDFFDIGFALLPHYYGKNIAYEATCAVLNYLREQGRFQKVIATTYFDNHSSIQLLKRLDFTQTNEIEKNERPALLFEHLFH